MAKRVVKKLAKVQETEKVAGGLILSGVCIIKREKNSK